MSPACLRQLQVDAYFAGRLKEGEEKLLRDHLPQCASCRVRYERHLLLERLSVGAPSAKLRLGRSLGFAGISRPARRIGFGIGLGIAAAAVLALSVALVRTNHSGFYARGEARSAVLTYQTESGAPPRPLARTMGPNDELAFAYDNAEGFPYLMVFAVDEQERVYWYHPAWTSSDQDPVAIALSEGSGLQELTEAVRHELPSGELRLVTCFLEEKLSVKSLEAMLFEVGVEGLARQLPRARLIVRRVRVEAQP